MTYVEFRVTPLSDALTFHEEFPMTVPSDWPAFESIEFVDGQLLILFADQPSVRAADLDPTTTFGAFMQAVEAKAQQKQVDASGRTSKAD
jgi:hypothetical protein